MNLVSIDSNSFPRAQDIVREHEGGVTIRDVLQFPTSEVLRRTPEILDSHVFIGFCPVNEAVVKDANDLDTTSAVGGSRLTLQTPHRERGLAMAQMRRICLATRLLCVSLFDGAPR